MYYHSRNANDDLYITHTLTSSFTERGVVGPASGGYERQNLATEVKMIDEPPQTQALEKLSKKDSLNYEV